jgi:hypothetical protein
MRQRAQRNGAKAGAGDPIPSSTTGAAGQQVLNEGEEARMEDILQTPLSPGGGRKLGIGESVGAASISGSVGPETPSAGGLSKLARIAQREREGTAAHGAPRLARDDLYDADMVPRSQSYNAQGLLQAAVEDELHIDDEDDRTAARVQENLRKMDQLLLEDIVPQKET